MIDGIVTTPTGLRVYQRGRVLVAERARLACWTIYERLQRRAMLVAKYDALRAYRHATTHNPN